MKILEADLIKYGENALLVEQNTKQQQEESLIEIKELKNEFDDLLMTLNIDNGEHLHKQVKKMKDIQTKIEQLEKQVVE